MIEFLILHTLNNGIYTMYGIHRSLANEFAAFFVPSIGTIKPALKRLEAEGLISTRKEMSKGGRPSTYYSITEKGKSGLKGYLLEPIPENPIQFLTNSRLRIYCSEVLNPDEHKKMIGMIKSKAEVLLVRTNKLAEEKESEFYPHIIYENLNCEYKNLILLLEGISRGSNR